MFEGESGETGSGTENGDGENERDEEAGHENHAEAYNNNNPV